MTVEMVRKHNFSMDDLYAMMPWELDVSMEMIIQHIETENEKIRQISHGI